MHWQAAAAALYYTWRSSSSHQGACNWSESRRWMFLLSRWFPTPPHRSRPFRKQQRFAVERCNCEVLQLTSAITHGERASIDILWYTCLTVAACCKSVTKRVIALLCNKFILRGTCYVTTFLILEGICDVTKSVFMEGMCYVTQPSE